ncbi:putative reverse transcriptase zinc-binding domain-containing protein [Helianthus annuus]|nr:putative reverse transcriptase zinc-binding domain-containing protein [Helianthus annuus]
MGDLPFVERWPHLFVLESNKSCRISKRLGPNPDTGEYCWSWVRIPESDIERKEWKDCLEAINTMRLSNDKDTWIWNIDKKGGFLVKSVKKVFIFYRGNNHLPYFEWSKWAPIKCNIMAWTGNLDRLATRVNLRKRNVDLASMLCPFCDEYDETVEHLFTACSIAIRVWVEFSTWCNIPPIFAFDFKNLMEIHKSNQGDKNMKKILRGLVIISCWCIWKARKELVFN